MISQYRVENDVMAYREVEYLNYLQGVNKAVHRSIWIADMRAEIWTQNLQITHSSSTHSHVAFGSCFTATKLPLEGRWLLWKGQKPSVTKAISHFVIDTVLFCQIMEPKSFEDKKRWRFSGFKESSYWRWRKDWNIVNECVFDILVLAFIYSRGYDLLILEVWRSYSIVKS